MDKYIIKISNFKNEFITYSGFIIDNCFVFFFEDNSPLYIDKDRFNLYLKNGKLKPIK